MKRTGLAAVIVTSLLLLTSRGARASTILITSESGITNDGLLDWNQLGGNFADVSNLFTTNMPGVSGLTMTGSQQDQAIFGRLNQGTWLGNFAPGQTLLWTANHGPVDFVFNSAIMGFGAQIQTNMYGAFTARIEAFDPGNHSLGFFTRAGLSNGNADDSAIFFGLLSSARDIQRVNLSVTDAVQNPNDFAINSPRIEVLTAVPEPASLLLLGTGLAVAGIRRRRPRAGQRATTSA